VHDPFSLIEGLLAQVKLAGYESLAHRPVFARHGAASGHRADAHGDPQLLVFDGPLPASTPVTCIAARPAEGILPMSGAYPPYRASILIAVLFHQ
jgi:hypothetical protein